MSHLWSCNRCFPFKEVLLSDWTRRNSIRRILSIANLVDTNSLYCTAVTICQVSCSGCSWCWSPPETSACTRPSVCVGPSPPSSLTTDPWQLWNHKIRHFRSWKFSKVGLLCLCAPQLYLWCEPPWGQSQKETALPSPPSIRSALRRNYFNHQLNGIEGEGERERERGRRSVGLDIAKKL